ncbi:hypothetical protein CMO91_06230 [Candidatus Woesearchaeota archaeon]|nr:hypothetical protein [Candidatus Woesearchaeota archaeon]
MSPAISMSTHMSQFMQMTQGMYRAQYMTLAPDNYVDPFHTKAEIEALSQQDVLKKLRSLIEIGNYVDIINFGMEVNRAIYASPIHSKLGPFGRDLIALITAYDTDENGALTIINTLGPETEKDFPSQTIRGWQQLMKASYFMGEAQDHTVLNLLQALQERRADLPNALSMLSSVSVLGEQPALMGTTLQKVSGYGTLNPRVMQLARSVLTPVSHALKESTPLTAEQSEQLYAHTVEALATVDPELDHRDGLHAMTHQLSTDGWQTILPTLQTLWPLQQAITDVSETHSQQVLERISGGRFRNSRDSNRDLFQGMCALSLRGDAENALAHMLANLEGFKSLINVLKAARLAGAGASYPYDCLTEQDILTNLHAQLEQESLPKLGITGKDLVTYVERLDKDPKFQRLHDVVTTMAGYGHITEDQCQLMGTMMKAEMRQNWPQWRYENKLGKKQLEFLGETGVANWASNHSAIRLVEELDGLQANMDAVKQTDAAAIYAEHYGPDAGINSPEEEEEKYADLLLHVENIDKDSYGKTLELAHYLVNNFPNTPMYEFAKGVVDILDQPAWKDARKVRVYDTDDLETMMRMGERPTKHCQNWKQTSTLNKTLLAFPADAYMKGFMVEEHGRDIGMSVVPIIDWNDTPTLLVMNIYANEWSEDHGIALLGSLADKAMVLHKATKKNVRIAAPMESGYNGHATNVPVAPILELFGKQYKLQVHQDTIHTTAPDSHNACVYYDCGPGTVEPGEDLEIPTLYVEFGTE